MFFLFDENDQKFDFISILIAYDKWNQTFVLLYNCLYKKLVAKKRKSFYSNVVS